MARDNGLPRAQTYVGLLDVAPPLADQVLAVLADAGIAAYSQPFVGRDPYQALKPIKHPSERIWVDHTKVDLARTTVSSTLPGLQADILAVAAVERDRDAMASMQKSLIDDQFADIATRLAAEGLGSTSQRKPEPAPTRYVEDEESYSPPPPPPLPKTDRLGRAAWIAVVGGPLLVILGALIDDTRIMSSVGLGAFIAGFITLVARMPDRGRHDDGWDDGAVV